MPNCKVSTENQCDPGIALKSKISPVILLIAVILILIAETFLYNTRIISFLNGTKWANSGMNTLAIIQDSLHTIVAFCIFFLLAYILTGTYLKVNSIEPARAYIVNTLLVFTCLLLLNELVKVIFTQYFNEVPGISEGISVLFKQLADLKSFSTGLDMIIPIEMGQRFMNGIIKSINLFSIAGFYYIYSQLNRIKKSNMPIICGLILIFIIISAAFGAIDITGIVVWQD